jgi:arylsulfatase A-like enzyme
VSVPTEDVLGLGALVQGAGVSLGVGVLVSVLLLLKSLRDYTRTGPRLAQEVVAHFRLYLVYSLARLETAAVVLTTGIAGVGVTLYAVGLVLLGGSFDALAAALAGVVAVLVLTGRQFLRTLLFSPGVINASSQYSMSHFYGVWERLTPARLRALDGVLLLAVGAWLGAGIASLAGAGAWRPAGVLTAITACYGVVALLAHWRGEPRPVKRRRAGRTPNVLLIGSDTLRADRLGGSGYHRDLTPTVSRLAARGTRFTDCYVPCARTAPSIVSMLTGTWPHTHRIRDTFLTPEEAHLPVPALGTLLREAGYRTAAVGDWAASDASKLTLGFDHMDMPEDQWNIKYLLRQGPKDLRLFLSLFTQNRLGKAFLPEIYYLGGIPLTEEVGRDTRRMIASLAKGEAPFFVMSFMATTHPPFTSKYPYYTLYADPAYRGPSKFAMAKLRDPFEIIRRQGQPRSEFDLDQILDLYDGCVRNFDDELGRVVSYLESSGLAQETIVVVFSDHGMEFFEHETWGQGNSAIGDFSPRVPLVIVDPRHPRATMVSDVVRSVDLVPTLLDLLELPRPGHLEGVSLAPHLRGESLADLLPAYYETGAWLTDLPGIPPGHLRYPSLPELLEVPDKRLGMISLKPEYHDLVIAAKDRMVRLGDWKLTYQPLTEGALWKLFNVKDDPHCTRDVIQENPGVADDLRRLLEDWLAADRLHARQAGGAPVGRAILAASAA